MQIFLCNQTAAAAAAGEAKVDEEAVQEKNYFNQEFRRFFPN